jgi:hypothetical protein
MPGLLKFLILATFPIGVLATIIPLTYQSSGQTFNDWVSLFTLCFAPLIAHVLAGVPTIVYLSQDRPTWRQNLGLYNPTTILWRYFAIADRRLRAKRWNAADISSSNVYFWTRVGWDGSEASIAKSQAYCVLLPRSKHATLISGSTVKTVIVTLQGADSLYYLLWSNFESINTNNFINSASIGSLFSPLTILGLLRLVACFWLTEDFIYINCEEVQTTIARLNTETEQEQEQIELVPKHIRAHKPATIINEPLDLSKASRGENYRSPNTWPSWLFRTLFLLVIMGLTILCTINLIPAFSRNISYTTTIFGILLFYEIFLVVTFIVLGYYFIRSRNKTTVLPCTSSLWYQVYTSTLFISMLVLIIIASLESWKSPCGFYTTYPSNSMLCGATPSSMKNTTDGVFGLAIIGNATTGLGFNFAQPQGEMSLLYFYGSCQGWFNENDDLTGAEGFRFENTTDRTSFLLYGA